MDYYMEDDNDVNSINLPYERVQAQLLENEGDRFTRRNRKRKYGYNQLITANESPQEKRERLRQNQKEYMRNLRSKALDAKQCRIDLARVRQTLEKKEEKMRSLKAKYKDKKRTLHDIRRATRHRRSR